ncbi:glycine betaine ABC transporter substrate-binding protein [Phytoactinopolyspora halotolerans]|uniref:Glycine betaine ABC transporter substrate-binding protein n=1 Tax=Phytoactinopolyspora halotolerans TaxID=1981512 RepID=A0A6L9S2J0_9ACTN|nr:glycine betaine ABC transporter substrate-binding protein [Phytoactinopolyspora halotolerans]NED98761.1 glycine betaine ABC transporter substrate-binding protein [Phytoactinopolyspora halotolerans]
MRKSRFTAVTAGLLAGGLLLAACGDDDDGNGDDTTTEETDDTGGDESGDGDDEGDDGGEAAALETRLIADADPASCVPASESAPIPDPEGTGDDPTEISVANFSGWDENYVVYELAKAALEEQGYTVTETELDPAAAYQGVADGDAEILMDAWLPGTHAQYIDQLGDQLEDLGCWFDEGFLTIAVNSDSPAQSLAELAEFEDEYGGRIVGIEEGAGLTTTTREQAIPTYGLDDWDFPTSSTQAMLAELESATEAGEDIVVTLWHPHWAYAAYDIRDLEDPEGAMGEAERLYNLGRPGFTEEYPNAAQLLKNLHLTNEQLLEIEDILVVENNREDNEGSVAQWLDENPDFLDQWRNGELG